MNTMPVNESLNKVPEFLQQELCVFLNDEKIFVQLSKMLQSTGLVLEKDKFQILKPYELEHFDEAILFAKKREKKRDYKEVLKLKQKTIQVEVDNGEVYTNLRESPRSVSDKEKEVRKWLSGQAGVEGMHDLHIWPMSTTETALTAHLLMPVPPADDEVQLRICAVALNHIDVWGWRGMAFAKRELPITVGVIIDSDQAQSAGPGAADREGFERLVADVGMGRAGIVMGLEVSRLARSCSSWPH